MERGQGVEQRGDGAGRHHPDHDPAGQQPGHVVHRLAGRGRGRERGPGVRQGRRPAAVSVAIRPDRSIRAAPRSRSSWRTCALTPDWLTWTRSAARVKFASSATATKYSSCLNSITSHSSFKKNYLLDFLTSRGQAGQCRTGDDAGHDTDPDADADPPHRHPDNRRRGQLAAGTEDHAWPGEGPSAGGSHPALRRARQGR